MSVFAPPLRRQIALSASLFVCIVFGTLSAVAAPAPPTHLSGQGGLRENGVNGGYVVLRWQTSLDAQTCVVSRNSVVAARPRMARPGLWQIVDSGVAPGKTYVYTVVARDRAQAQSPASHPLAVKVPPIVNPQPGALPAPTLVTAKPDDDNAILTWAVPGTVNQDPLTAGPLRPDQQEPPGVTGFLVTWGPQSNPSQFQKLSVERMVQLQPLVHGTLYTATVQAVDALGDVSPPSAPVTFAHDFSRVDALRAQMTGFFDDFDTPAGPFDELKWNTSFASGDDPALSGAFVNAQFHAHDMVSNKNGFNDREWVMNRPRAVFDVTGRTGTLVFDMDGEFRRDQWYLDFVPEDYAQGVPDTTGQTHLEDSVTAAAPGDFLRVRQTGQTVSLFYVNPQGVEAMLAETDWTPRAGLWCAPLDWQGLKLVRNVRRHWRITYSQTHCVVFIDNMPVLAADYSLSYSRVVPLWLAFSYNTVKGNAPVMLLHWDNFGFDGPASPVTTHNYKATLDATDFAELQAWQPGGGQRTYTLCIPDSLAGTTARRMMLSLTCRSIFYTWAAADHVSINGHDFPIADPQSPTGLPDTSLVTGIAGFPVVLNVPNGIFHTGDNFVTVSLASGGVMNVHAEFDWPSGTAPAYTTPMAIYDPDCAGGLCPPGEVMPGMPPMPIVGPGTYISALGGASTPYLTDDSIQGLVLPVSRTQNYGFGPGLVPVDIAVSGDTDLASSGTNHGVDHVTLTIDGLPDGTVFTRNVVPAPGGKVTFLVDVTKLTAGTHALFATAYAPDGTPGAVDYDGALSKPGQDYSLHISVGP